MALDAYRALVRTPGLRLPLAAAFAGRLPGAMLGFALILSIREDGGSYASAGAAVTLWTLGIGVTAPLSARLADRLGRTPVLLVCAAADAALLSLLAAGPPSTPALLVLCLLAGALTPPLAAAARSLWPVLLDGDTLAAAFAADAVATELQYVVGP